MSFRGRSFGSECYPCSARKPGGVLKCKRNHQYVVLTIVVSNGCSRTMAALPSGIPSAFAQLLPSSCETHTFPVITSCCIAVWH